MLSSPFAFYSLIVLWITQIKYEVAKALSRMDITIYTKHQQSCYHSYESMKCGRLDLCLHSLENPDVVLRLPDFPQLYLIWQVRLKISWCGWTGLGFTPSMPFSRCVCTHLHDF